MKKVSFLFAVMFTFSILFYGTPIVKAKSITKTYTLQDIVLGEVKTEIETSDGVYKLIGIEDMKYTDKEAKTEIFRPGTTELAAKWIPDNPNNNGDGSPGHFLFGKANGSGVKYDVIGAYITWWGNGSDYLGKTFKSQKFEVEGNGTRGIGDIKIAKKDFFKAECLNFKSEQPYLKIPKISQKIYPYKVDNKNFTGEISATMEGTQHSDFDRLKKVTKKPPLSDGDWVTKMQVGPNPKSPKRTVPKGQYYNCGYYEKQYYTYKGTIKALESVELKYSLDEKPKEEEPDKDNSDLGEIIFAPNRTTGTEHPYWTNETGNGNHGGKYPVNVKYTGQHPFTNLTMLFLNR